MVKKRLTTARIAHQERKKDRSSRKDEKGKTSTDNKGQRLAQERPREGPRKGLDKGRIQGKNSAFRKDYSTKRPEDQRSKADKNTPIKNDKGTSSAQSGRTAHSQDKRRCTSELCFCIFSNCSFSVFLSFAPLCLSSSAALLYCCLVPLRSLLSSSVFIVLCVFFALVLLLLSFALLCSVLSLLLWCLLCFVLLWSFLCSVVLFDPCCVRCCLVLSRRRSLFSPLPGLYCVCWSSAVKIAPARMP